MVPGGHRLTVCGVLLAAGGGNRFGGIKQLAPLDGKPLVQHALDAANASAELDRVVVVLGAEAEGVRQAVAPGRADVVVCSEWAHGMSRSLRAGVAAAGDADWVVVILGDEPTLPTAAIERVVAAARAAVPGTDAVRATWSGRPGHPVALARELARRVDELEGDVGARALMEGVAIVTVECGDLGPVPDVDTRTDLERLS